jgi:hypothetical protein
LDSSLPHICHLATFVRNAHTIGTFRVAKAWPSSWPSSWLGRLGQCSSQRGQTPQGGQEDGQGLDTRKVSMNKDFFSKVAKSSARYRVISWSRVDWCIRKISDDRRENPIGLYECNNTTLAGPYPESNNAGKIAARFVFSYEIRKLGLTTISHESRNISKGLHHVSLTTTGRKPSPRTGPASVSLSPDRYWIESRRASGHR